MKLKVNQDVCIGCGACQAVCDEVFQMNDEGLAEVVVDEVSADETDNALDAKEGCPVGAIEEVNE